MTGEVPAEGDVITHERTFTREDVREFGRITGDEQSIHTEPDEEGRLVVQGLLAGSLMTKIGGDLGYIARTMEYDFRRPVHTGEPITCEWTVESKEERSDRYLFENGVVYTNADGERVIEAATNGLVWRE
jgi:acyl dehydratase